MPIRAVLFDIGGVLELTPDTGWAERRQTEFGISLGAIFARLDALGLDGSVGPCTEQQWLDGFREASGLTQSQVDAIMGDLWEEYLGTPNQPLIDWFAALRPRYKVGIISNSFVGAREREQARYGFEDMTDDIVYSHEVGMRKPDPRIYELACTRLGVSPRESVFVDDHDDILTPARAMGMIGILYSTPTDTIAQLEAALKSL
jgi:putative hydrolase of the HAD superfamily